MKPSGKVQKQTNKQTKTQEKKQHLCTDSAPRQGLVWPANAPGFQPPLIPLARSPQVGYIVPATHGGPGVLT